jgi:hypothetical protein
MNDITHAITTEMDGDQRSSSDLESISYSHFPIGERFSYGGSSSMLQDSKESTAQSSETNLNCSAQTLSERLTPLLISVGLVKGTTLTFGLRLSSQGIQAGVSFAPDGSAVAIPRQVCMFLRECRPTLS